MSRCVDVYAEAKKIDIGVHTSDIRTTFEYIRVTYEYIRVSYKWHTSTYDWHTNGIRVHTDDLRTHRNDIRMTYEYIWVTYEWHTSGIRVHTHTIDIRMTYKLYTKYLLTWEILNCIKDLELLDLIFKTVCGKIIAWGGCKSFLGTMLFQSRYFLLEYSKVQLQCLVIWIIWKEPRAISCSQVQC